MIFIFLNYFKIQSIKKILLICQPCYTMAVGSRSSDGSRSGRSGSRRSGGNDTGSLRRCSSSGGSSSGSGSGSSGRTAAAAPAMSSIKFNMYAKKFEFVKNMKIYMLKKIR